MSAAHPPRPSPDDFSCLNGHVDPSNDRALCVALERPIPLPSALFERVQTTPAAVDRTLRMRLRAVDPIDQRAWSAQIEAIKDACAKVTRDLRAGQTIHVFMVAPHALAAWVGRCLDDLSRDTPVVFWQFDPNRGWTPLVGPGQRPARGDAGAYFSGAAQTLWRSPDEAAKGAVLALDFGRQTPPDPLESLAKQLNVKVIRQMGPLKVGAFVEPDQVRGALAYIEQSLAVLQSEDPTAPIYITTCAPLAMAAELGRMLRPTVFGRVVFTLFEKGRYVPTLDVAHGALVRNARPTLRVVEQYGRIFYQLDGATLLAAGPEQGWEHGIPTAGTAQIKAKYKAAADAAAGVLLPRYVEEAVAPLTALDVEIELAGWAALLPWEHMRLKGAGRWFAQREGWTLSRFLPERPIVAPKTGPERGVRVLIVPGLAHTDEIHSQLRLDEIGANLAGSGAVFEVLPWGLRWHQMREKIRAFDPHIVQLVAHGSPTEQEGYPAIMELQGDGFVEPLDRDDVQNLFADLPNLRLALLGSCSLDNLPGGGGVPSKLLSNGTGAVISFRDDLYMGELGAFSLCLFKALRAMKSVREAVAEARRALMDTGSGYRPGAFAAPLLTCSSPLALGPIFEPLRRPAPAQTDSGAGSAASDGHPREKGPDIGRTTATGGATGGTVLDTTDPTQPPTAPPEGQQTGGQQGGGGEQEDKDP